MKANPDKCPLHLYPKCKGNENKKMINIPCQKCVGVTLD